MGYSRYDPANQSRPAWNAGKMVGVTCSPFLLHLTGWAKPQRAHLKALRAECVAQARQAGG